jgi:hypothetical protein
MRLWSIHPKYLDAKGIVALWREGLLAQNVLLGNTKGYKNHPQLIRFKEQSDPVQSISNYLHIVCNDADSRGYNFQRIKIVKDYKPELSDMRVTTGQLSYEWEHLLKKLELRDNDMFEENSNVTDIEPHPLFAVVKGEVALWEIV